MAFNRENLTTVTNNVKSGVVVKKWLYFNEASDTVTAASYFSDYRFVAGDIIEVVSANGANSARFYVASVTAAGVVTLGGGTLTVTADGTNLSLGYDTIAFNTTAEAFSYALADGIQNQIITMVMTVDGGNNAVITPAHLGAGSTLTFADVGDSCTIQFVDTDWWVIANNGVAVA